MRYLKGGGNLPPRPTLAQLLKGLTGGFLGILILGYLGKFFDITLLIAPFGATCVIIFAVPTSPLAQPRNVILGHLITSAVGLAALYGLGDSLLVSSLAVGVAIMLMQFFRAVHPPAGANPLVIIAAGKNIIDLNFLITPIVLGSIILILIALVINNLGKENNWPVYWHGIHFGKKKND